MTVLAAGDALSGLQSESSRYGSLTLLVTLEEAEILIFAQQKGRLVTVLRHPEDIETRDDIPKVKFEDILETEYRRDLQTTRNRIEVIRKGKEAKP